MPKVSSSCLRKKRTPSPVQSSDSEADDDELEQLDKLTIPYSPNLATQWSTASRLSHQLSVSASSMHTRLLGDVVDADESPFVPPIDTIPPEILIHILRQLPDTTDLYSCLLVSHKWCECSVELLWLKPHFSRPEILFNLLHVLENRDTTFAYASFIRRLNFSSVSRELDDARFAVLAACTRLERLTLNGCERLTDEALIAVLSCTSDLVALDLTNVCDVTDRTIAVLAATSPKLQGVNLEGCKKVTDDGILALARGCPYLRRIKLCELEEVTSVSISELVSKCPPLIEIDLTQCSCITDLAVRDIWKNSLQLRELRLGQCFHITDQGFPVAPRLAQLPTNAGANAQGMENNLAHVRYQSIPPLLITQPLIHLRQLDLMNLNITDDAVEGIIVNAPKIRNLVLAKCTALTDKAVKSICNLGKHLHCLHLGHAAAITDESIILLAKSCPRLRYVDLACKSGAGFRHVRQPQPSRF
jgi:F-box and leucine-rich repeat protein GRR1